MEIFDRFALCNDRLSEVGECGSTVVRLRAAVEQRGLLLHPAFFGGIAVFGGLNVSDQHVVIG